MTEITPPIDWKARAEAELQRERQECSNALHELGKVQAALAKPVDLAEFERLFQIAWRATSSNDVEQACANLRAHVTALHRQRGWYLDSFEKSLAKIQGLTYEHGASEVEHYDELLDMRRQRDAAETKAMAAEANAKIVCDSYAEENQRLSDRATAAEAERDRQKEYWHDYYEERYLLQKDAVELLEARCRTLEEALREVSPVLPETLEDAAYKRGYVRGWSEGAEAVRQVTEEMIDRAVLEWCSPRWDSTTSNIYPTMRAALEAAFATPPGRRWRHLKRGSTYTEVGRGMLQCASALFDHTRFVVYRGDDGQLWVRPETEFEDGRFEEITEGKQEPTP